MAAKLGHPEAIHQIRKRKKAIIINSYDKYFDHHKGYYYGYLYS